MAEGGITRKLTAILYADVADYSRHTGEDEVGTHRALSAYLDLMSAAIEKHGCRVVHYAGDAVLADFGSVVAALSCSVEVQNDMQARNEAEQDARQIQFRIGLNLGEVIVDRNDIYGDGVNVAARLESLAEPGGICVSASVHDQVRDKVESGFQFMGRQKVKNIAEPVPHYRVLPNKAAEEKAKGKADLKKPPPFLKPLVRVALLALLLLVGVGVWQAMAPSASAPKGPPSLAVLPFRTIGGDEAQKVFSEGLSADLAAALSADPSIRVVTGAVDAEGTPEEQGRKLKAQYVFEGTVRGEGKIRVTAQLIDTRSGFHLWGGRYDRDMADTLKLQTDLSGRIVATLTDKLNRIQAQRLAEAEGAGVTGVAMSVLEPIGRIAGEAVTMPADFFGWLLNGDDS